MCYAAFLGGYETLARGNGRAVHVRTSPSLSSYIIGDVCTFSDSRGRMTRGVVTSECVKIAIG